MREARGPRTVAGRAARRPGFALGPVTGRLIAEMMNSETPLADPMRGSLPWISRKDASVASLLP